METLLVYALLTSALFYLGSRAVITSWLWSRYPPRFARFMDCAACSGAWFGLIVGITHNLFANESQDLRIPFANEWWSPIVIALCSVVWTPVIAGIMQAGFERLGSAVGDDGETD